MQFKDVVIHNFIYQTNKVLETLIYCVISLEEKVETMFELDQFMKESL